MRAALIPTLILLTGLAGCVEQEPGLTVIVRVDPEPATTLPLPDGPLTVERARLFPGLIELVPCETTAARFTPWRWLIGSAQAHGEGSSAFSAALDPIDAGDDTDREIARIPLPPGVSICALHFGAGAGTGVGLAGRVDGAPREWLVEFETAPRLPLRPLTLGDGQTIATLTVRFALRDWAADLPDGDDAAVSRAIAANAAAALTVQTAAR